MAYGSQYNKRKGFPVRKPSGTLVSRGLQLARRGPLLSRVGRYAGAAARAAVKIARNRIMTRTMTRTRNNNVKVEGVGGQISKFKAGKPLSPWDKKLTKDISPNYRVNNVASRLTSTPGQQNVVNYGMFTNIGGDINDIATANARVNPTGETTRQGRTNKFLVAQGVSKWLMTNQDQGNCCVEIYDIAVRRDTAITPDMAFFQGLQDQADIGSVTVPSAVPGSVPTQSELFNTYFKVIQKTRIVLGSGQSHTHYQNVKPNKWYNEELLFTTGNATTANSSLKGFTVHTMIVAHGMPYNDLTTQTQVSTGQVALDIVYTKQLKYYVIQQNFSTTYANNTLPTSFTVQEEIMNPGLGTRTGDLPA